MTPTHFVLAGLAIVALTAAATIWLGIKLKRAQREPKGAHLAIVLIGSVGFLIGWAMVIAGAS